MKSLIVLMLSLMFTLPSLAVEVDVIELVKEFEGFKATAYQDGTDQSIGYGSSVTRAGVYKVTKAEAEVILKRLLNEEEQFLIKKLGPTYEKLNNNQKSALISMAYNNRTLIGPKLCSYIKAGNLEMAAREIAIGHKGEKRGLIIRRCKEANIFLGKDLYTEAVYRSARGR